MTSVEKRENMTLTELYEEGRAILKGQKLGFTLDAVETGWVRENNRRIMDRYAFRQRAINAPASAETKVEILGVKLDTPVIMSAMTMPIPGITEDGLLKVARGLKQAGSLMWTGTPLPAELEELVATGVPLIANVKPFADRDRVFADIEKIQKAGVEWVGVEIDAGQGTKIHDQQVAKDCIPLALDELIEIRKAIKGRMVLKGVLSAQDAILSLEARADAVMVSNHGAHTIDYLPHPFQVAEEVMGALAGRIRAFLDCGIRRGTDVLKALTMGATLVGLGRPILYGLAANGAEGVRDVVKGVTAELARTMTMVGAGSVAEITPGCIIRI